MPHPDMVAVGYDDELERVGLEHEDRILLSSLPNDVEVARVPSARAVNVSWSPAIEMGASDRLGSNSGTNLPRCESQWCDPSRLPRTFQSTS